MLLGFVHGHGLCSFLLRNGSLTALASARGPTWETLPV
jgi:hypothetical protein